MKAWNGSFGISKRADMKKLLRHLLAWYLASLARLLLLRERPTIIAVAGTVNKSFAVQAIAAELRGRGIAVETTPQHFNTDIGLPLAILGLPSGYDSYEASLSITPRAMKALKRPLPAVLVLEMGIDRPGDMRALLRIVEPHIAVITDITQRYRENFGGLDKLAHEYGMLLEALPRSGLAVLNYDTMLVRDLAKASKAPLRYVSLGSVEGKDILRAAFTQMMDGIAGTVHIDGQSEEFALPRFGRHHALSLLIARAVSAHASFKTSH